MDYLYILQDSFRHKNITPSPAVYKLEKKHALNFEITVLI